MRAGWVSTLPEWLKRRGEERWDFVGFDCNGVMPARLRLDTDADGWSVSAWPLSERIRLKATDRESAKREALVVLRQRIDRIHAEVTEALDQLEEAQP